MLGLEVGVSWGDVHVVRHSGGQREAEGICVGGGSESQDGDLHLSRPGQSGLTRHGIAESELDCKMCNVSFVRARCQSGGIIHSTWSSSLSWWPEGVARQWHVLALNDPSTLCILWEARIFNETFCCTFCFNFTISLGSLTQGVSVDGGDEWLGERGMLQGLLGLQQGCLDGS